MKRTATAKKTARTRTPSSASASTPDARQAIFETAERLAAEQGLEAVSVRDIAAAAGVNLAALNYYYGSRTNLLLEILRVRSAELSAERDRLLENLKTQESPSVRDILRAAMAPLAQWRRPGSNRQSALMFLSRVLTAAQPDLKQVVDTGVRGFERYIDLLQRALPKLSRTELYWRFHFMMALEHMNAWDEDRLMIFSAGACATQDPEEALERALDFAVAGFMAPVRSTSKARRRA